jgi:hypothetical protein
MMVLAILATISPSVVLFPPRCGVAKNAIPNVEARIELYLSFNFASTRACSHLSSLQGWKLIGKSEKNILFSLQSPLNYAQGR